VCRAVLAGTGAGRSRRTRTGTTERGHPLLFFNNSTGYNVRFTYDGPNVALSSTTSDSEYVAPSSGWSIGDVSHYITNNNKLRR